MAKDVITADVTFEGAVNMCLLILERGTPQGKEDARNELLRYGRELDRLKAQSSAAFDTQDTPVEGE